MALTKDDLRAISALLEPIKEQQTTLESKVTQIEEQQKIHTRSIMTLENKVMHELKILNENLPDVIARHEELNDLRETVDDHDHRIFALEQMARK